MAIKPYTKMDTIMKLWYDDKKIPTWLELIGLVVLAVVLGCMFALSI